MWSTEEYEKLPQYDGPTFEQSPAAFQCHEKNGRLCSGWVGCHNMDETLAIRFLQRRLTRDELEVIFNYESPVELWGSGQEAYEHGIRDIRNPSIEAIKLMAKITGRSEGGTDEDSGASGDA